MKRKNPVVCFAVLLILFTLFSSNAFAIPILSLGNDSAIGLEYSGGLNGLLSTIDDGNTTTIGEQDISSFTFLNELSFLNGQFTSGSFTLDNVKRSGDAVDDLGIISQDFSGGMFSLYDNTNTLLLQAQFSTSSLLAFGTGATAFVFENLPATFTGGSLVPNFILPANASFSFTISSVKSGNLTGLQVENLGGTKTGLAAFTGESILELDGDRATQPVPEPATSLLLLSGLGIGSLLRRKAKSS